jgi:hypothetical protein
MSDDKRQFLKAAEGRVVRREADGAPWPTEGDWAETSLFIRRRIADGDLVKTNPPKPSKDGDVKVEK